MKRHLAIAAIVATVGFGCEVQAAPLPNSSPHKVHFVTVQPSVKLEVLDWGGAGRPLIFLAGLGATAHDFDQFALHFTAKHHVYGITRRGFGASDKPKPTISNFASVRLGEDVLAVMDALKIERPVVAGHSIAGSELSSVASRHPERISGLIYLDAAYIYAFYTPGVMPLFLDLDLHQMRARLSKLDQKSLPPARANAEIDGLLESNLPQLDLDLRIARIYMGQNDQAPLRAINPEGDRLSSPDAAIIAGLRKYGAVKAPVLAIYAFPKRISPGTPVAVRADAVAQDAIRRHIASLFVVGNPGAKVVHIANSEHDIYNSNPVEVEREMDTFMDALPR